MKVAGFFAGSGGLELGLERSGHETVALCEIMPSAQAVLKKHFPGVALLSDVRRIDAIPDGVDLLTFGFPCQDLSQVGSTRGLSGPKSGAVKAVFRLLRRRTVPWLIVENVPFMLRLDGGAAIRYLTGQLERLGYRWAYRVIDTRAFGLPHRRERVFLVASLEADPARLLFSESVPPSFKTEHAGRACGFYWTEGNRGLGWAVDAVPPLKGGSALGIPSPPGIWLPRGKCRVVTPDIRDAERLQGFPADWTNAAVDVSPERFRWTLVGNAVSVPVAEWIGRTIGRRQGALPIARDTLENGTPWPKAAFGGPREQRYQVECSTWPVAIDGRPLADFLEFDAKPLSQKATSGFYGRLTNSTLHRPTAFDSALRAHMDIDLGMERRPSFVAKPALRSPSSKRAGADH